MVDNFYPRKNTEISLRDELINTFDGLGVEISKKQRGLLRVVRLDSSNNLVECACVDIVTHEPDKDEFCSLCLGSRYVWDEQWIDFYKKEIDKDNLSTSALKQQSYGMQDVPLAVFWLKYDAVVKVEDKIVEINLDIEGEIPTTVRRTGVWLINRIDTLRSDNGRIEFFKVYTSKEDVRFLNSSTD